MAVSAVKTWVDDEILTHTDLNAEFANIYSNGEDLAWPATKAKDFAGQELILDDDGDTSITADTDDQIDFKLGNADVFRMTATDFLADKIRAFTANTGLLVYNSDTDQNTIVSGGSTAALGGAIKCFGEANASANLVQILSSNTSVANLGLSTAGSSSFVMCAVNDGSITFSGSNATNDGPNIVMRGSAHASPDTILVRHDGTTRLTVDVSANTWDFGSGAITMGDLAVSGSTGNTIVNTGDVALLVCDADHATYTKTVIHARAARVANASYNLFAGTSDYDGTPDIEFSVDGVGTVSGDGAAYNNPADYAEYFEWADGNPTGEERAGLTVALVGNRIRLANPGDEIIGVVSARPAVVGDAGNLRWTGKYEKDEFNREVMEDYEALVWDEPVLDDTDDGPRDNGKTRPVSYAADRIPAGVTPPPNARRVTQQRRKLNPNFDPTAEYIPRKERQEWDAVGLVGKLRVRVGQPVNPRWIKMRDISPTVEEWLVR